VDVALARARDSADYQQVLRRLQGEIEHVSRLVDQLLLLAQADAGNLKVMKTRIDVADFMEETAARWQPVAEMRRVTLDVAAPGSGAVYGDAVLLRTVLDNLIDNAIRYSPTLAVVKLTAERQGGDWVIEVADQGPGVPEEMREHIFDRFARADTARTRRGGGAGLGLSLSAAVVGAHGGSLRLADDASPGARFQIRLPAEVPTQAVRDPEADAPVPAGEHQGPS
jgi:signal transduction histidine kinase